jgi:dCMP deaminase
MKYRKDFNTWFMDIAKLISERSTCIRREVGAVIVKNNRIVSTGYNGPPSGMMHCTEKTCIRNLENIPSGESPEKCRGVHAETNAIIFANRYDLDGAVMYSTVFPCSYCIRNILNSGIKKVYYLNGYNDAVSKELSEESLSVEFIQIKG